MRIQTFVILCFAVPLAACTSQPDKMSAAKESSEGADAEPDTRTGPTLPTVAAPLTRRDLLLAAAEAASAYSAGTSDIEDQRLLDGRPFSLVIRLCQGDQGRLFQRTLDKEGGVLRLQVRPDLDAEALGDGPTGQAQFEAVEGFWIPRPWLLDAACPAEGTASRLPASSPAAATIVSAAPAPLRPTVGIAQFFDANAARSRRRADRPYEVTRNIPPDTGMRPTDLLIEGRVSALPGGKTITCSGRSATAPPRCVISVRVDQVILRQPGGEVLAKWGDA